MQTKTFNKNKIKIGDEVRFWDIWNEDGDENEILESGAVWVGNNENNIPIIADFTIVQYDKEKAGNSIIRITDIR